MNLPEPNIQTSVEGYIRRHLYELNHLGISAREPISLLWLGGNTPSRRTIFPFCQNSNYPFCVLKFALDTEGRLQNIRENNVINLLNNSFLQGQIKHKFYPRIFFFAAENPEILILEFVQGTSLFKYIRERHWRRIKELQEKLQPVIEITGSIERISVKAVEKEELQKNWLQSARAILALPDFKKNLSEKSLNKVLCRLKEQIFRLPCGLFQHGDLFPKNIFLKNNETIIIDWANSDNIYPPLFDLVIFFSTLWLPQKGKTLTEDRLRHFREIFWGNSEISHWQRRLFEAEIQRLQLSGAITAEALILLNTCLYANRIITQRGIKNPETAITLQNVEFALKRLTANLEDKKL